MIKMIKEAVANVAVKGEQFQENHFDNKKKTATKVIEKFPET